MRGWGWFAIQGMSGCKYYASTLWFQHNWHKICSKKCITYTNYGQTFQKRFNLWMVFYASFHLVTFEDQLAHLVIKSKQLSLLTHSYQTSVWIFFLNYCLQIEHNHQHYHCKHKIATIFNTRFCLCLSTSVNWRSQAVSKANEVP